MCYLFNGISDQKNRTFIDTIISSHLLFKEKASGLGLSHTTRVLSLEATYQVSCLVHNSHQLSRSPKLSGCKFIEALLFHLPSLNLKKKKLGDCTDWDKMQLPEVIAVFVLWLLFIGHVYIH